jgi:hypothetical protein
MLIADDCEIQESNKRDVILLCFVSRCSALQSYISRITKYHQRYQSNQIMDIPIRIKCAPPIFTYTSWLSSEE